MLNEKKIGKGGQLTIPAHLRRELGIQIGEKVAIKDEDGRLVLERVTGSCMICGGHDDLVAIDGKYICQSCIIEATLLMEQEMREQEAADV